MRANVMFTFPLITQLEPVALKYAAGLAATGLLGVFMWPFRKAKSEWIALKKEQASIHAELVQQRTNCLTTLQTQGAEQITLLKTAVEVLGGVRLDLAEQTGYLAGAVQLPRRRRTAKKKK